MVRLGGKGGASASGGQSGTGGVTGSGGAAGNTGDRRRHRSGRSRSYRDLERHDAGRFGDRVDLLPADHLPAAESGDHSNFQLVGMETTNQSCGAGAPSSIKDEGHAGYGVTYLPQNNTRSACTKTSGCGSYAELLTWAAEKPDIVLMHFGTNDVWDGIGTSTILSAYLAVIAEFRKQNPNVIFFVSKIIKLSPAGCTSCLTNVAALAAALTPSWASTNSTATRRSASSTTTTALRSDEHRRHRRRCSPHAAGATIMATVTFNAIAASGYF